MDKKESKSELWHNQAAPTLQDKQINIAPLPLQDITQEDLQALGAIRGPDLPEVAEQVTDIFIDYQEQLGLQEIDIQSQLRDPLALVKLLEAYENWLQKALEKVTETKRIHQAALQKVLGNIHNRVKGFRNKPDIQGAFEFLAVYFGKGQPHHKKKSVPQTKPVTPSSSSGTEKPADPSKK